MRSHRVIIAGLLAAAPFAAAGAQSSLTIYNDGRVLVRQTLPVRVSAGTSNHRLALGPLDPGSVFSPEAGVFITGAVYDAAVDEASTMRRAIGRKLIFDTGRMQMTIADTIAVEVLGVDPERFRLPDGGVTFQRPGRPRYPIELVQVEPTLAVTVRSPEARPALTLGWFTSGASWRAGYEVVLGRGEARITGSAVLASDQLSADSAEIQLLAGQVTRAPSPAFRREMMEAVAMAAPSEGAAEEAVGETHVYTLPGRYRLRPKTTTTAALFDPATAPVERSYVVPGTLPWVGPLTQAGDESRVPVEVHYLIRRPAEAAGFAARPLPAGTWRLYERDTAGRLQMVGEAMSRHTAAGQDVRLPAGTAFDLTARRVQTEYTTRRDSLRTTRVTAGYRVTLANAKDSAVVVDVLEERRGDWQVLSSSVPAERLSSTQVRFRLRVPAKGEAVLTYRVQVTW